MSTSALPSSAPSRFAQALEPDFVLAPLTAHEEAEVEALLAGLGEEEAARLSEPMAALLGTMASSLEDRLVQSTPACATASTTDAVRFCLTGPEHGFAAVLVPALQCRLNPVLHLAPVMSWLRARLDSPRFAERLRASGITLDHEDGAVWLRARAPRPALRRAFAPPVERATVFVPEWARSSEAASRHAPSPREKAPGTEGSGG